MYKRYQPTKDSYDMIYGGFQSMGVPLNHPFQLGIFHENNQPPSIFGVPPWLWNPPLWKTAWDKLTERSGWIHWILQVQSTHGLRPVEMWKSHGFHRHHRHNPDLMFSLPWAYRGNFCVFLAIDKLREGSRNCVGSEVVCKSCWIVGYVWGIKPG